MGLQCSGRIKPVQQLWFEGQAQYLNRLKQHQRNPVMKLNRRRAKGGHVSEITNKQQKVIRGGYFLSVNSPVIISHFIDGSFDL